MVSYCLFHDTVHSILHVALPSAFLIPWRLTQCSSFLWTVSSLKPMECFITKLNSCPFYPLYVNGKLEDRWLGSHSSLALDTP